MGTISGDEACRLAGNGNRQKWFVIRVRQGAGHWRGRHRAPAVLNKVKESNDLYFVEPELWSAQDFGIFG